MKFPSLHQLQKFCQQHRPMSVIRHIATSPSKAIKLSIKPTWLPRSASTRPNWLTYETIKRNPTTIQQRCNCTSTEDLTWLWEASDSIKAYNEGSKHGTRNGCLEFTLNSVKPLEEDHFHKTLQNMITVLPNMKTVIRQRENSAWYCRVKDPKIDFKVMSDEGTFREDCRDLLSQGFSDTDSLPVKVRAVARGPETPCYIEGVKDKYPYQYDIGVLYNHAMCDGMDLALISGALCDGLNSCLSEKPLSSVELGSFEKNTGFEELKNLRRESLLRDPERYEMIKSSLQCIGDVPMIFEVFPRPNVEKVTTEQLDFIIDENMMKGLQSRCSEKGVTVNSFIISVFNVALAELMQEASFIKESYDIACLICVTGRRFSKAKKYLLGNHFLALTYKSQVRRNTRSYFWEYCQRVNHGLHEYYRHDGFVIDQFIVQEMLDKQLPPFNYTDNPRPVSHDFTSTFIPEYYKHLPIVGEYVQITDMNSFQNIHNFRTAFMQEIYVFRGRTHCNFYYCNNYFKKETIQLMCDRIFHLFGVLSK